MGATEKGKGGVLVGRVLRPYTRRRDMTDRSSSRMETADPRAAAARAALARGDLAAALGLAARAAAQWPELAEAHFIQGVSLGESGRVGAAIEHVRRAVVIAPVGEYRAQLARLLSLARRDGEAAEVLAEAEQVLPADALGRDTMGCVYARLGRHDAALPHFAAAVAMAPDNGEYRYNLAVTHNFLGQVEQAEAELEALIARAPDGARAHHLLAGLRRQTAAHNHVERLTAAAARAADTREGLLLGHALAKELEDLGEEGRALATLCEVNRRHRRGLDYAFARDEANFVAAEAAWPALEAAEVSGAAEAAPIFIVGMPRTGTTLVDRIVSSHPEVASAGELQAMPVAVKLAAGTGGRTVLDPETLMRAARGDIAAIGHDYLRRAAHHLAPGKPRFSDKFPGNFHYLGFIARALPNARIVCLRRHPVDTVLSNFRNLFAISSPYYDYSYDLLDIAAYYLRFDRLMAFWRDTLPGRVLELRYEDLVADQEAGTRRLLAHCGLGWDARCLSFHDNAAAVATPSAPQVRRPIYHDSVDRWRRHGEVLAPVLRMFAEAGIAID